MPTKYFYEPTQVKFYDEGEWIGGIAWHDFIICGCCGDTCEIADIYEEYKDADFSPIVVLPWLNISEEIIGE